MCANRKGREGSWCAALVALVAPVRLQGKGSTIEKSNSSTMNSRRLFPLMCRSELIAIEGVVVARWLAVNALRHIVEKVGAATKEAWDKRCVPPLLFTRICSICALHVTV